MLGAPNLLGLRFQRGVLGGGGGELGRQPCCVGFERGHHVGVGRRLQRPRDGAPAFGHHAEQSPTPLRQPLHARQRHHEVLFALRGELGRSGLGIGVELADRGDEGGFALGQPNPFRPGRLPAGVEAGELTADEVHPQPPELLGQRRMRPGRRGLAFEGPDLAAHFPQQVAQTVEILLRGGQAAFGPLAPTAVFEDPGRFLDHGAAILGPGVEDGSELALAHDHVLLTSHPRVRQQLLDVEQATGLAVDGVLALTRSEQRPGDGDLRQTAGESSGAVVDGERHLGPPQGGTVGGAGEDDVFHLRRAHGARPLRAEHPRHGVDDIGLPAAVGADHDRHAGLQEQRGRIRERLETLEGERLQEHRPPPYPSVSNKR